METKTCHKYGYENLLRVRTCFNCGERLTAGANILYLVKMVAILGVSYLVAKLVIG